MRDKGSEERLAKGRRNLEKKQKPWFSSDVTITLLNNKCRILPVELEDLCLMAPVKQTLQIETEYW